MRRLGRQGAELAPLTPRPEEDVPSPTLVTLEGPHTKGKGSRKKQQVHSILSASLASLWADTPALSASQPPAWAFVSLCIVSKASPFSWAHLRCLSLWPSHNLSATTMTIRTIMPGHKLLQV